MDGKEHKTFYGGKSENICAYCYKHRLYLTPQQLKTRECLKRNCNALKRYEHPMWEQKKQSKEKRVSRKDRLEALYKASTGKGTVPQEEIKVTPHKVSIYEDFIDIGDKTYVIDWV